MSLLWLSRNLCALLKMKVLVEVQYLPKEAFPGPLPRPRRKYESHLRWSLPGHFLCSPVDRRSQETPSPACHASGAAFWPWARSDPPDKRRNRGSSGPSSSYSGPGCRALEESAICADKTPARGVWDASCKQK